MIRIGLRLLSVGLTVVLLCSFAIPASAENNGPLEVAYESFETPNDALKSRPLWFWNTEIREMTEEEVREIVRRSALESGYNGFGILPNWIEDYLSEEYFELYGAALDEGHKYGMEFSLYDENGFPSYNAGGLFGDTYPDLTTQQLDKYEKTASDGETVLLTLPEGTFMGAVAMNSDTLERIDISGSAVVRDPAPFDPDGQPMGVSASSTYSIEKGYEAEKAVDGDADTRWNAASQSGGNAWLQINFGEAVTFDRITAYEPADENLQRTRSFMMQYFDTETGAWVTLHSGSKITGAGVEASFEPVTAQLVRLYLKKISTDSATISEFAVWNGEEKRTVPESSEVCDVSAPYLASSVYELDSGYEADKAFDNDSTTRWNAGAYAGAGEWLQLNLDQAAKVDSVYVSEAFDRISAYRIQCYTNGSWQTVKTGTAMGANKTLTFAPVETKSIRLCIDATSGSPSIWEFSAYSGNIKLQPGQVDENAIPEHGSYLQYTVPEGNWQVMVFYCVKTGNDGMDYLNPDSVAAFIELTYDAYYAHFKEYFDNGTITTAFYDEPTFWPWGTDYGAPGGRLWTPGYNEKYSEMYNGESPVLYYPALWYDIGEETAQARNQLQDVRTQMYAENYIGQLNDWCTDHGIQLTGHMLLEEWVNPVGLHGDLMRVFQYQDIPGVDVIGYHGYTQEAYKIVSSSAYNWDKGLVMTESYGAMGHNMDPKVLYKSGMDQYAKGINLMIPHAVWYDDAAAEVDYPPELSYRNELYADVLPEFNNYIGRLNSALQYGRHVADIAMLYPIDYLESEFIFNGTPCNPADADYMQVGETLSLALRRDFTYLHPSVLDEKCTVSGDTLHLENTVNYEDYKVLILPATQVISLSNLQKIKAFYDAGGKIIATTTLPTLATKVEDNAAVQKQMKELFGADYERAGDLHLTNEAGGQIWFVKSGFQNKLGGILDEALAQYDVEISGVSSVSGGNLSYIHKVKEGVNYYFIANSSDTAITPTVQIRGEFDSVQVWDPMTGERRDATCTAAEGVTTLQLPMTAIQSLFIVTEAAPETNDIPGDVDGSDTVDVADIMKLKSLIMADKWSEQELAIGDLDGSGRLDVGDIMAIKNIIMAA